MTSPVPDETYYDAVKIIGVSGKYFPFKESPFASIIKYYYDFSEPKFAKDRMFQAFWVIQDNKLFFEYAKEVSMDSYRKYNFNEMCLQEIKGSDDYVLAIWYSGKIIVQTNYDWGFINENGSFPDISTKRLYTISKGIITEMVEECEFVDPVPF